MEKLLIKRKSKYLIFLSILLTVLFLSGFVYAGAYQVNALENGAKRDENSEMKYGVIKDEQWYYIAKETQLRSIGNPLVHLIYHLQVLLMETEVYSWTDNE